MVIGSMDMEDIKVVLDKADKWDFPTCLSKNNLSRGMEDTRASYYQKLSTVNEVSGVKDLGIIITSDFEWTDQLAAAAQNPEMKA